MLRIEGTLTITGPDGQRWELSLDHLMEVLPPTDATVPTSPAPVEVAVAQDDRDPVNFAQEYNVKFVDNFEHYSILDRVKCMGCGVESISLEDRMLRPPGVKGCPSCQQKAKFG